MNQVISTVSRGCSYGLRIKHLYDQLNNIAQGTQTIQTIRFLEQIRSLGTTIERDSSENLKTQIMNSTYIKPDSKIILSVLLGVYNDDMFNVICQTLGQDNVSFGKEPPCNKPPEAQGGSLKTKKTKKTTKPKTRKTKKTTKPKTRKTKKPTKRKSKSRKH